MRKLSKVGIAAVTLVGSFGLAVGPASAASQGTITHHEAKVVVKQMKNQKCLTKKETRRIVHGSGHTYNDHRGWVELTWKGGRWDMHTTGTVAFWHGCARHVSLDYDGTSAENWVKKPGKHVKYYVTW